MAESKRKSAAGEGPSKADREAHEESAREGATPEPVLPAQGPGAVGRFTDTSPTGQDLSEVREEIESGDPDGPWAYDPVLGVDRPGVAGDESHRVRENDAALAGTTLAGYGITEQVRAGEEIGGHVTDQEMAVRKTAERRAKDEEEG